MKIISIRLFFLWDIEDNMLTFLLKYLLDASMYWLFEKNIKQFTFYLMVAYISVCYVFVKKNF